LQAGLRVRFHGVEKTKNNKGTLIFRYEIVDLGPDLGGWTRLKRFASPALDQLAKAAGAALTDILNKKNPLQFALDVPLSVVLPIDASGEDELELKQEKRVVGTVTLKKSMSPLSVTRELAYQHPVFFKSGVWLFIEELEPGKPRAVDPPLQYPDDPTLDRALTASRQQIEIKTARLQAPQGDFAFWLANKLGVSLVRTISAAPPAQRTVSVRSIASTGDLYRLQAKDKTFGVFGIKARLPTPGAATGNIALESLIARSSPAEGLTLTAVAASSVSASIRVEWDGLLIKRAAVYDVDIHGQARAVLNGTMRVFAREVAGLKAAYWGADLACTLVTLQLASREGALFGAIPVRHAQILADVPIHLFEKPQPASLILSSLPQRSAMIKEPDSKDKSKITVIPPAKGLDVATSPTAGRTTKEGYYLYGDILIKRVNTDKFTPEEIKKREELERALKDVKFEGVRDCPPKPPFRLVIKGLDFGPEGEVIQYITAGLKSEEEKLKALEAVFLKGRPQDAPEHLEKAIKAETEKLKVAAEVARKKIQEVARLAAEEARKTRNNPLREADPRTHINRLKKLSPF
jgi:hypothetical protein